MVVVVVVGSLARVIVAEGTAFVSSFPSFSLLFSTDGEFWITGRWRSPSLLLSSSLGMGESAKGTVRLQLGWLVGCCVENHGEYGGGEGV